MNQKIAVTCIAAALAAWSGCQRNERGAEPGQEPGQEPQVVAPQGEAPGEEEQAQQQGDGLDGTEQQPGDGEEGRAAPGAKGAQGERGAQAGAMDVADLLRQPEARVGERVTVMGQVDSVLGERGLKLKSAQGGDQQLVVLGRPSVQGLTDELEDKSVRVTGTLRRMAAPAELERELGWNISDDVEQEISGQRVVLIANSVEPSEGGAQQGAQPGGSERMREQEQEQQQPGTQPQGQ